MSSSSRAGAAPSMSKERMPSANLGQQRSHGGGAQMVEGVKLIIMMRAVLYESSASPSGPWYAPLMVGTSRVDTCGRALRTTRCRVTVWTRGAGCTRRRLYTPIKQRPLATAVVFVVLSAFDEVDSG